MGKSLGSTGEACARPFSAKNMHMRRHLHKNGRHWRASAGLLCLSRQIKGILSKFILNEFHVLGRQSNTLLFHFLCFLAPLPNSSKSKSGKQKSQLF